MIMNKKIFYGIAVFVVAVVAVWNVNFGSQIKGMSDISLANVEALAWEEIGSSEDYCNIHCVYSPGRCWFNIGTWGSWPNDCQPSGITSDHCTC